MQLIRDMQAAPSEADLIKDTVDVLTKRSAPEEEVLVALEALQILVEPIDYANGESKGLCLETCLLCSCDQTQDKSPACNERN